MRSRLASWLKSDQVVLVAFGTHGFLGAFLLGWEVYVDDAGRFFMPHLWPPVFFAAWVATFIYHRKRDSRTWWKASGALLFTAYLSRAATLTISANQDDWTFALAFGIATWLTMALAVEVLWVRVVTPHRSRDADR